MSDNYKYIRTKQTYFDVGNTGASMKIYCRYRIVSLIGGNQNAIFGQYYGNSGHNNARSFEYAHITNADGSFNVHIYCGGFYNDYFIQNEPLDTTKIYEIEMDTDKCNLVDIHSEIYNRTSSFISGYKIFLGADANNSSLGSAGGTFDIFEFKMWHGSTLIWDLEPYESIEGYGVFKNKVNDTIIYPADVSKTEYHNDLPPEPIPVPINKLKRYNYNVLKQYEGSSEINKMYYGDSLVYQRYYIPPAVPTRSFIRVNNTFFNLGSSITKKNMKVYCKFRVKQLLSTDNSCIYGNYSGYNNTQSFTVSAFNDSTTSNRFRCYCGGYYNDNFTETMQYDQIYELEQTTNYATLSEIITVNYNKESQFSENRPFYIGKAASQNEGGAIFDFFEFKIWYGDVLTYDLEPYETIEGYGAFKNKINDTIIYPNEQSKVEYMEEPLN